MQERRRKELSRCFDKQTGFYEAYARRNGLQSKRFYVLMWIYFSPDGITQKQIIKETASTKQVVSSQIESFFAKGYITFTRDEKNKRNKLLQLTPEGEAFAQKIFEPLVTLEKIALDSLSEEEQAVFLPVVQKYSDKLVALFDEAFEYDPV